MSSSFQTIRNQVMWDRLINVVEEQARTMMRVAFSPVVREAGDLSAGVFNIKGELLAQAITGTPGLFNSMARSVTHFMDVIPPGDMRPGDSYVTNDPWKGTGHLFDLVVVTPAFHDGQLVALFACTAHVADIGGTGPDPIAPDVFTEGLFVPITPLCIEGEMNAWLINLMRANSREPDRLEGDIYALVASNETGADRLNRMMEEYGLDDIEDLSDHILETSDKSMLDAVRRMPRGEWTNSMRIDGFDKPLDLVTTVTNDGDYITIDFDGTSGISRYGINCAICYTDAYTSFGAKCLIAPHLANNAAVLARIKVTAPEGCLVNAPYPSPVTARQVIGHMLPDAALGCFAKAMPGEVQAEGTAATWNLRLGGGTAITGEENPAASDFASMNFQCGGMGGHPRHDGMSATAYPAGIKAIALEVIEALTPMVFWKRELRPDSGGAGKYRGGLGQVIEVANREPASFALYAAFQRMAYPARGLDGGDPGAAGRFGLKSGDPLGSRGKQIIPAGDRLLVEIPGGGGLGNPIEREPEAVLQDVVRGLVSGDMAREIYKVAITEDFTIDQAATRALRQAS